MSSYKILFWHDENNNASLFLIQNTVTVLDDDEFLHFFGLKNEKLRKAKVQSGER